MTRIEYTPDPATETITFAAHENTSVVDILRALPGTILIRPDTPFEAACDRIRETAAQRWLTGGTLLPTLFPAAPDL